MWKLGLLSLVLIMPAAALPQGCVVSPKVQQLVNALSTIGSKVVATNTAVTGYTASGGLVGALSIQQKEQELDKAVQDAVNIAHAGAKVTNDCDVAGITEAVNAFAPSTSALLSSIVQKKPEFDKVGVTNIVSKDLTTLNVKTNSLIGEAYAKLPCSGIIQMQKGIEGIQASYLAATRAYGVIYQPAPSPPKC